MRGPGHYNLIMVLISLAVNVVLIGIGLTCGLLYFCALRDIDLVRHLWLIAIPPLVSLLLNVLMVEAYLKITRR